MHRNFTVNFDLEEMLTERWPPYLPDPSRELWRYTPDELVLLRVLAANRGRWVRLNYVLVDGSGQAVNNAVRKLRRKGFTIEGRKRGGYCLVDHLPPLLGGTDGGADLRQAR